jgi:hypothetical protein
MTLKDDNDFKMDDFIAGQPEYFEPYYGTNSINNDHYFRIKLNF